MALKQLYVKRETKDVDFQYPICFEKDFQNLALQIRKAGLEDRRVCIITDSHVGPLYAEQVRTVLLDVCSDVSVFTFEAGEKSKNLDTIQQMYEHLIRTGIDRKGLLAALGGGVVGDMTGFCAATYLRGIDFIQIPTSLLAQVDSSVGGKTGVDFRQYKNMVGAFHQPRLVYMNLNTLKSLPSEEFASGMGEVLKTGLICDVNFYEWVCKQEKQIHAMEFDILSRMIRRCCEIKAGVVERDPKEQGERALLNLGHTVGHAVEKLKDFQLLHGQCVGIGLIAAAALSRNRGILSSADYDRICQGNELFDLPLQVSGLEAEKILAATKKDKKMQNGQIRFILLDGLGKAFIDTSASDEELLEAVREILI